MEQSLVRLIQSLTERGWAPENFAANHLAYAASLCLGSETDPARISFEKYWRSVAKISSILREAGVFHVIIKTRRSYPYADTNVDVFIEEADWPRVRDSLCGDSWRMPSRMVQFKQRLIEREKIKLPPRDESLVPAHMYMAVSWRYQREVTFLDREMIEDMPLAAEAPQLEAECGPVVIPVPTRTADILLHCAEIVFENYRITLGESLYLSWLMEQVPEVGKSRVFRLGIERGAGRAMRCALFHAGQVQEGNESEVDTNWPKNLPGSELLASWGERFRVQLGRGKAVKALEEWLGYTAFASMYRVKRSLFK